MPIPDPSRLIANYPHGEADQVKRNIGGGVNASYITNTCAIRLSRAFNYSGAEVPKGAGMLTVRGADKKNYALRVAEFRKWLESRYGRPTLSAPGKRSHENDAPPSFQGRKGVICFVDCGWSDASGHLDLWDGQKCVGHAYFDKAREVYLWEPTAPPRSAPKTGKINVSSVNVRSESSTTARILGTLPRGAAVTIYNERNGFAQIAANGWVIRSAIGT